jgi:hypothetical protein
MTFDLIFPVQFESYHIFTYLLIFVDCWCSSNSSPLDLSAFDDCQAGHWGVSGLPSLEA